MADPTAVPGRHRPGGTAQPPPRGSAGKSAGAAATGRFASRPGDRGDGCAGRQREQARPRGHARETGTSLPAGVAEHPAARNRHPRSARSQTGRRPSTNGRFAGLPARHSVAAPRPRGLGFPRAFPGAFPGRHRAGKDPNSGVAARACSGPRGQRAPRRQVIRGRAADGTVRPVAAAKSPVCGDGLGAPWPAGTRTPAPADRPPSPPPPATGHRRERRHPTTEIAADVRRSGDGTCPADFRSGTKLFYGCTSATVALVPRSAPLCENSERQTGLYIQERTERVAHTRPPPTRLCDRSFGDEQNGCLSTDRRL